VESTVTQATVVVIGAGQAGLSAAYHLLSRGFVSALTDSGSRTFVVLDREVAPGGAWQHRWSSLRMATVNGIFDLPGYPKPPIDECEASRDAVPRYFAAFEDNFRLPIFRPVHVAAVRAADANPDGDLIIETDRGRWRTRALINATGTWTNPLLPYYPGTETFLGRQLHTWQYTDAEQFTGQRVIIVGGGISAIQQLEEISRFATTVWYTRREPVFLTNEFRAETTGRAVVQKVAEDVEAGLPSGSIVSYSGLPWTSYALAARDRGVLRRRPMFTAIEPLGVRDADGSFTPADVILWATGFRPALAHLEPLHLHNEFGGIRMRGTQVAAEPRVQLVGFGPSQSTVGANRAGRAAVRETIARLDHLSPSLPVSN
jgi:cation diffusion facilitator CzcD-associated flavoprotein CzcO